MIGAGVPFVLGTLMLVRFRMSLPVLQAGEAQCGTGVGSVLHYSIRLSNLCSVGAIVGSALRASVADNVLQTFRVYNKDTEQSDADDGTRSADLTGVESIAQARLTLRL